MTTRLISHPKETKSERRYRIAMLVLATLGTLAAIAAVVLTLVR